MIKVWNDALPIEELTAFAQLLATYISNKLSDMNLVSAEELNKFKQNTGVETIVNHHAIMAPVEEQTTHIRI